jgi:hypothetical protein
LYLRTFILEFWKYWLKPNGIYFNIRIEIFDHLERREQSISSDMNALQEELYSLLKLEKKPLNTSTTPRKKNEGKEEEGEGYNELVREMGY